MKILNREIDDTHVSPPTTAPIIMASYIYLINLGL